MKALEIKDQINYLKEQLGIRDCLVLIDIEQYIYDLEEKLDIAKSDASKYSKKCLTSVKLLECIKKHLSYIKTYSDDMTVHAECNLIEKDINEYIGNNNEK